MQFDIRRLDIYRKIPKDLTQPTRTGAVLSCLCIAFICFLLCSELAAFVAVKIESDLFVDEENRDDMIPVRLNVTVEQIACEHLGLDIQDDLGRHDVGFIENTAKFPANGGAGCRLESSFRINKVPGNFHISTHAAGIVPDNPSMAHTIHDLTFGSPVAQVGLPGALNPLRATDRRGASDQASHDYIMKIVPTIFETLDGRQLRPFQYSVAYRDYVAYGHGHRVVPAIWFRYDLNPISVRYRETRQPLYVFLTSVCAIVGGTFTVAGILDSLVFTAIGVWKKIELGKQS